ncbi:MAG: SIR2 family protein [Betaproteobacteria bacterium]|nr:SIR2 family protein [Betaproteobacteria bacterium]
MSNDEFAAIADGLRAGRLIPYLGPGLLEAGNAACVPATDATLVARLSAGQPVPARIRRNLTAVAQYIENFRHRKALRARMVEVFDTPTPPGFLHRYIAGLENLPLVVDTWYDDALLTALAERREGSAWGQVQGVSRAEHRDIWHAYFHSDGSAATAEDVAHWRTLVYKPIGCIRPSGNFLISDSDFVEVLTEIDIQTPIPPEVKQLRQMCGFLFLGCRFATQLERIYARQIMKRSAGPHWAVIDDDLTRNESRFLSEQRIYPIHLPLEEFSARLVDLSALIV